MILLLSMILKIFVSNNLIVSFFLILIKLTDHPLIVFCQFFQFVTSSSLPEKGHVRG